MHKLLVNEHNRHMIVYLAIVTQGGTILGRELGPSGVSPNQRCR